MISFTNIAVIQNIDTEDMYYNYFEVKKFSKNYVTYAKLDFKQCFPVMKIIESKLFDHGN